ncbi:MAG: response regulator [Myxococcales bacterium]|nr:response regulator [Myxococcales bacterium]
MSEDEPKPSKVLFVDDEPRVRQAFARQMRKRGLDVQLASDGEQALELAEHGEYPVVVTDVRMPRVDGLNLIDRLRKVRPQTTFVIVTGAPDSVPKDKAADPIVESVITKPWDREEMMSTVERALTKVRGHAVYLSAPPAEAPSERRDADDADDQGPKRR